MILTETDFLGDWQLERQIVDALTGQVSRFSGRATFTAAASHVRYHEVGTLQLAGGGAAMHAERSYRWLFGPDDVTVQFADGAPFHSFPLQGEAKGTAHLCGADLYQVTYSFADWPGWRAVWAVAGPRKDYVSTSQYARA